MLSRGAAIRVPRMLHGIGQLTDGPIRILARQPAVEWGKLTKLAFMCAGALGEPPAWPGSSVSTPSGSRRR